MSPLFRVVVYLVAGIPLLLVAAEYQDDEIDGSVGKRLPYSETGWWRVLRTMSQRHGARKIYGDPTGIDLLKSARAAGLPIKPADNRDKDGRLQLLNAQCHVPVYKHVSGDEDGFPAFLVSRECPKTAHCLQTLQWRKDRQGNPTNKPSGYNDHLADCLCYTAGRWARPLAEVPAHLV